MPTSAWACGGRPNNRGHAQAAKGMASGGPRPLLALFVLVALSGCARSGPEVATIITNWSEADCAALEAAIPTPVSWVRTATGEDPTRLVGRVVPVDLVLGGPVSSYRRLEQEGRLLVSGTSRGWEIARRVPIGLATRSETIAREGADPNDPGIAGRIALGDPRGDANMMAWARAVLAGSSWSEGYARLIRTGAQSPPIGLGPGAATALLGRGAADAAPSTPTLARLLGAEFVPVPAGAFRIEGLAIVRGTTRPDLARRVFQAIAARDEPGPEPIAGEPLAAELLADLLGATLVDSQDELRAAWRDLIAAGRPGRPEMWMTMAPPWPPASIGVMLEESARGDPDAELRLDTLAEQVAPSATARAWLRESWSAPTHPIDGHLLDDLARAADGRLASEPRFRAWLRAEWTAWARQRYRRVARLANS